jgi:hypothetical protein
VVKPKIISFDQKAFTFLGKWFTLSNFVNHFPQHPIYLLLILNLPRLLQPNHKLSSSIFKPSSLKTPVVKPLSLATFPVLSFTSEKISETQLELKSAPPETLSYPGRNEK